MIERLLAFVFFKASMVSSASWIKSGYSNGKYDASPNTPAKYYKS